MINASSFSLHADPQLVRGRFALPHLPQKAGAFDSRTEMEFNGHVTQMKLQTGKHDDDHNDVDSFSQAGINRGSLQALPKDTGRLSSESLPRI